MIEPILTKEELITATVASLEKWGNPRLSEWHTSNKCGFCVLVASKGIHVSMSSEPGYPERADCFAPCPAGKICYANIKFWDEILFHDKKQFDPGKFKYQKKRIQKNIDWLNDYLKELRE